MYELMQVSENSYSIQKGRCGRSFCQRYEEYMRRMHFAPVQRERTEEILKKVLYHFYSKEILPRYRYIYYMDES